MLLYFKVKNSRSFVNEAELSMIATEVDNKSNNSIYNEKYNVNILKNALIYGANASGKSNLLKALHNAIFMILKSATYSKNKSKKLNYFPNKTSSENINQLNYSPNKTSSENINQPTFYTIGFLVNNKHFEYSFSNTANRIESEILTEYPKDESDIIHFNRIYIKEKNKYIWPEMSKNFKDKFHFLKPFTKKENLFLSVASQLSEDKEYKISIADEIWSFFDEKIRISIDITSPGRAEIDLSLALIHQKKDLKILFLNLLEEVDFTIKDIVFESVLNDKGEKHFKVFTYHNIINKNNEEELIKYDLFNEESVGTLQFIAWIGFFLITMSQNNTLIIDEFGNHMHPHLTEYLLKFLKKTNNCQLICTTHNVKLMNSKDISNDEKWIVDRDKIGNSKIYSVSEFEIDKDKMIDNVYLDGFLGGIPNIKKKLL